MRVDIASDKTRANILIGLATKLKLFAISGISTLTDTTDVPIEMIGQKKDRPIALFIFMPDSDRTYTPVINMLISTILKRLGCKISMANSGIHALNLIKEASYTKYSEQFPAGEPIFQWNF